MDNHDSVVLDHTVEPGTWIEEDGAVSEFELPRNLVQAANKYDRAESGWHVWMAALPFIVGDLARRWSLEPGRPFQPGGVASWVALAHNAAGERVVLKVAWRHGESLHEAEGLRAWGGDGTVRLLDSLVFGDTSAMVLEACEPGVALSRVLPPREQDSVVAALLRRLWIEPPIGHPFRSLQSMCDTWAEKFEQKYSVTDWSRPRMDPGLARAGVQLLRSLPGTAKRSVLLCTDLHTGNVLAAKRAPWLVIDPKPYVGDPTYDPLQHMLNFPDRLIADPASYARRMADLLDLDTERLRHWLFARCIQESVDHPHLANVAVKLAP